VVKLAVINILLLEHGLVLDVSGLIDALVEGTGTGAVAGFSISLPKHILALHPRNITTIPYNQQKWVK
jgi:hypothetical protein